MSNQTKTNGLHNQESAPRCGPRILTPQSWTLLNDWAHNGPFGRASRQGSVVQGLPRVYEDFVDGKASRNHGTSWCHIVP